MLIMSIERKFCPVVINDEHDSELHHDFRYGANNLSWDDLYETYNRILIISTAGTGKTYECKQQTKRLQEKGLAAFFLELAELANFNSTNDLLSHDEERIFNEWLNADTIAYFFLDSIDELQLTQKRFETALRNFTQLIQNNFNRVKVIITSRPTSFDVNLITTYVPVEPSMPERNNEEESSPQLSSEELFIQLAMHENKNITTPPKQQIKQQIKQQEIERQIIFVGLKEFANEDILAFAQNKGVDNPAYFLEQLLDNNSIDINSVRQPQYLMELCHDWKIDHTIHNKHKRLSHLIDVLLHQRTDRREKADLSLEKAKEGVQKLALAIILTKKTTILYDEASDNSRINCFDPRKILTDFTLPEWQTLLERPIFLPASYGKVRFSHRSITEYLAANQLNKMIDRGFSIKSAKRLIFTEVNKELIIKPCMRYIAAWLACFNSYFFEIVKQQAPELFFQESDMSLLSDDQKVIVLQNYIGRYKKYAWRNEAISSLHIEGATCEKMTKAIVDLWPTIENKITRFSLMELMAKSPIPECADIAYENASRSASSTLMDEIRAPSLVILSKLNDSRFEQVLNDMISKRDIWSSKNIEGVLLGRLYPYYLKETSAFLYILSFCNFPSHHVGFIDFYWPKELMLLTSKYPIEIIKELQEGLSDLIINSIVIGGSIYHLEVTNCFLLPALAATCIRLINDGKVDDSVLISYVYILAILLYTDSYNNQKEPYLQIKDVFDQQPLEIREKIFWLCDEFGEKYDRQHEALYRLVRISNILTLSHDSDIYQPLNYNKDKAWIIECLANQERDFQERLIMLEILLRFKNSGCLIDFNSLKDKVADNPTLTEKIENIIWPVDESQKVPLLLENEEIKTITIKHQKEKEKARESWHYFYNLILNETNEAFGEKEYQNTIFYLWNILLNKDMGSHSDSWNRRLITEIFNNDICNQFRKSLMHFWRSNSPTLRSERPLESKNRYSGLWNIGITAISAEAEDPEWAAKLTVEEAKLAARYATIELNSFPTWFESLIVVHREAVIDVIGNELKFNLEEKLEKNGHHGFLFEQIKKLSPQLANIFSPILMDWVNQFDNNISDVNNAADANRFEEVINLLLINSDTNTQNHIKELIHSWLEKYENNSFFTVSWLKVIMLLSPEDAINQLKKLLIKEIQEKEDNRIAVKWLSAIFKNLWYRQNENYDETLKKLQSIPHVLTDLILLTYEYVRPEEDLDRANGGAYSPNARDHAENIRRVLLDTLLDTLGDNVYQYKINLLDNPLLESSNNYIWNKIQQGQMNEVCEQSLNDNSVIDLINNGIVKPNSSEEMFHLMLNRLEDLEEYLLSDYSPKATWKQMKKEFELRRAIADFLNTRSRSLYTINQEAVTADEKETDIRLVTNSYVAVIELKLGNNWSGKELRDTIGEQLVKQYMQPENRKAGCLLIVVNTKRNWEHPDTGARLNIDGLQKMLDEEARKVVEENKHSIFIEVCILDLCKNSLQEIMI